MVFWFALDALLLYIFSIPVVMKYRILPVKGTPYWLFGILFLVLTINVIISLYAANREKKLNLSQIKQWLIWFTIAIVVGGTTVTAIVDRNKTAPVYGVHDIILQQEAAMRYLLENKNPYKETYFGTPVEEFHYDELGKSATNPALYHFVMPPWYLIFPFVFYFFSVPLLGYFDGRMVLLFCLLGLLIILWRWFKSKQIGSLAIVLLSLSPATIDYFIEGRSDIFALFWLVWSLYLLDNKKFFWSSVIFGLAILSKQTIWFVVPFYVVKTWFLNQRSMVGTIKSLLPVIVVVLSLTLPFIYWDTKAFFESVIFYLNGNALYSYPVSGYGLGMVLWSLGVIKNIHAYYPFILWQILLGIPIMTYCLRWFMNKSLTSRLFISYAISLSAMWYLSRYFNNSHLGYISSIFTLGVLKDLDEKV